MSTIRLLKTNDEGGIHFERFPENQAPKYAILSHTWGHPDEEVTFQDMIHGTGSSKAGFSKIRCCIETASRAAINHCWIDTCCIDKSSSAELSMSINSMFRWYQNAKVCYAYLADVLCDASDSVEAQRPVWEPLFRQSRWFERGWTLQELIAPRDVEFYSKEWARLGCKQSLEPLVRETTKLPINALLGKSLSQFSYDDRKSWASSRETTIDLDRVYCLLGILDVPMHITYGVKYEWVADQLDDAIRKKEESHFLSRPKRQLSDQYPAEPQSHVKRLRAGSADGGVEDNLKVLMEALTFDQIQARQMDVSTAQTDTCNWLSAEPEYRLWLNEAAYRQHYGLLWIKGKPGSGKSTLMKFAVKSAQKKMKRAVHLSFFFNARGSSLEKSIQGAYRTLLWQLFDRVPHVKQAALKFLGPRVRTLQADYDWAIETLQEMLDECLESIEDRSVMCFVDALDECKEEEIHNMLAFFKRIGKRAFESSGSVHFCVASRYYPNIKVDPGLEIKLDGTEGHENDLKTFIASNLQIGNDDLAEEIRAEVLRKSNRIFMWVILVVPLLRRQCNAGDLHEIWNQLKAIPNNLDDLFEEILTRDTFNRGKVLACIQWVLFAREPLSPKQLYLAIRSTIEEARPSQESMKHVDEQVVKDFLLDASKGLAERTKSKKPTMQFIHESVRDFLLKEKDSGLAKIWTHLNDNVVGRCQIRLAQGCSMHLLIDPRTVIPDHLSGLEDSRAAAELRASLGESDPFLMYAVKSMLYHANEAATHGMRVDFLQQSNESGLRIWKENNNILLKFKSRQYSQDIGTPFIFAHQDYPALLQQSLQDQGADETATGSPWIWPAVELGHTSIVKIWLDRYDKAECQRQLGPGSKPFWTACVKCKVETVRLLIGAAVIDPAEEKVSLGRVFSLMCKKLSAGTPAASLKEEGVIEVLLQGVDVYAQELYSDLLDIAIAGGHDRVVQILLKNGADVNAQGGYYGNALQVAAFGGHDRVVQILLENGADVNAQGGYYGNALQAATFYSHDRVVQILLENGADVNAQGGYYGNALQAATVGGYDRVVQILLKNGADVNAQGGYYGNALQGAAAEGYDRVVQLLLENGADVNVQGGYYGNALRAASRHEDHQIFQILKDARARPSI